MGAAESKLRFKNKVYRLAGFFSDEDDDDDDDDANVNVNGNGNGNGNDNDDGDDINDDEKSLDDTGYIPTQDPYWKMYWEEPQTADDIYNLLTANDLKSIRDSNRVNFLNLLRIISIKIIEIGSSSNFPDDNDNTEKKLLNCIRTLTKIIPFLFEKQDLRRDTDNIFWNLSFNNIDASYKDLNSALANDVAIGSFSSTNDTSLTTSTLKVNVNQQILKSPNSLDVHAGAQQASQTIGQQLITTLVDLLFTRGFTLEKNGAKGTEFKIWEVGIGLNGKYRSPDPQLDSNRLEVLRLLITLSSQGLYSTPKTIVNDGSKFLTVLVCTMPRLKFLTLICSLLNNVCRSCNSDPEQNGLNYQDENSQYSSQKFINLRKQYITYSLQLLSIMLVYPIPIKNSQFLHRLNILPHDESPHNLVRSYLGRLHKENELNFIYQAIKSLLTKPMELALLNESSAFNILKANLSSSSSSFNSHPISSNGYQLPVLSSWTPEVLVLLWELLQCNKNFRNFIYMKKSPELIITLLFYIKNYKNHEMWKNNLIRPICHLFLYMTTDPTVQEKLLNPFSVSYYTTKLPASFKLNTVSTPNNLSYRDFIIVTISNIIVQDEFDNIITPSLFEYLYNLVPLKSNDPKIKTILSYHASLALVNIINRFSTSSQLQDNIKSDQLALIIRAIVHSICRHHKESRTLLFVITKHEKVFTKLLGVVQNSRNDHELGNIKEEPEDGSDKDDYNDNVDAAAAADDGLGSRRQSVITIPLQRPSGPQSGIITPNNGSENTYAEDDLLEDSSLLDDETLGSEFEESLRPKRPIGMSLKAKSKLPVDVPFARVWPGYRSLLVILQAIKLVKESIPEFCGQYNRSDTIEMLIKIENIGNFTEKLGKYASSEYLSSTLFECLKFSWSGLSLGWYESILWSRIFHENQNSIRDNNQNNWFNKRNSGISVKEIASNWGFNWKSTNQNISNKLNNFEFDESILQINIWNGTFVRLFKVKKAIVDKPLVDVNNLMKRFRLNSASSIQTINTLDSKNSINSPMRVNSQSGFNSPNQLTPINSRQSFNTPRNSIQISRHNSNISIDYARVE